MRLVFATPDFRVDGRSYEGFPILLGRDCLPIEPAQSFLWQVLVGDEQSTADLTWESYGRWMYDYFAFLNANDIAWDHRITAMATTPVARYRDWSVGELGLEATTVNHRLRLVRRFYEWANTEGHIDHLPFRYRDTRAAPRHEEDLAHVRESGRDVEKLAVLQREWVKSVKFLTRDQVRVIRNEPLHPSHSLLFQLMVRVGLRSCEARTFPKKYVFNPRTRTDLVSGRMIRLELDPRDMHIKNAKPRSVDIPYELMADMYSYQLYQREVLRACNSDDPSPLVLNERGTPFTRGGVIDIFEALDPRVGFKVRPHMLRHTYATHALATLRQSKTFKGDPLSYVRDRLGHASVQVTAGTYLHLVDEDGARLVLAHEDEIDALFAAATRSERVN